MTEPRDPRTPQERAYALDESYGATPPDESQQGPTQAQQSTEHDDTRVLHTDDPTAAYGTPVTNPTLVYPEPGQPYPPAPGYQPTAGYQPTQDHAPTQQYPAQQYQPTQQYQQMQQPTAGYQVPQGYQPTQTFGQPPDQSPPGYPPTMPPGGPDGSQKTPRGPRWGILLLAAVVLIALGATIGLLLSSNSGTPEADTGARPFTTAPSVPATPGDLSPESSPSPPLDQLPGGLGEIIGDSGAVVGTVTANDGTSVTISGIGGSPVTVLLTPETQIITLSGDDPSSLTVGSAVVATGTPVESGRMTAETVVSASIPSFDGPGR